MDRDDVRRSKRLALVLRHRPAAVGITLDAHGWVDVTTLLDALARSGDRMSREELDRVVRTNDKQRFEWDRDADRIRARQGHSVAVDLELQPLPPPPVLFHGTTRAHLPSIMATGLEPRGRHHVHLSVDEETARRVGGRRGRPVVLVVDAAAAASSGHTFWRTTNGIWLTDHVPAELLREIG